ncbi:hypothetical protein P152DRAFT_104695 [Eremomyces bilateralis CBS 781.70]|uniref:Uncharacterized protein n=1 Tax=Eremomyces bilateralis CBS 781.70 TaxID=1392243 RepID=A0A6G1FX03_9PEZI|nr:uncharacterized protein P152DRAFT_104695 [Eremomyces bilateralis CBS 781.70]KAF1810232.1 hypothetical protein P152DRAFT_104695 [Eremomyces bilateralis CBS 781.70]
MAATVVELPPVREMPSSIRDPETTSLDETIPPRYSTHLFDDTYVHSILSNQPPPRFSRVYPNPSPLDDPSTNPNQPPRFSRLFPQSSPTSVPPSASLWSPAGKTTLSLSNAYIYPPDHSTPLYRLPRTLTWPGNEISLQISTPARTRTPSEPPQYKDRKLYTMRKRPFTTEVTLQPHKLGAKSATVRSKRSLLGGVSWEVEVKGSGVIWKSSKGKWKDARNGRLVAVEGTGMGVEGTDVVVVDELHCLKRFDQVLLDLIVAAWCTKMWQRNTKVPLMQTLIWGGGFINPIRSSST